MEDELTRRTTADVIVVGGGLSGLRAATLLQEKGVEVILLEATARVGGRTCSEIRHSHVCELGGQFVGKVHIQGYQPSPPLSSHLLQTQDKLKALADELGVERHPQFLQGRDVLVSSQGTKVLPLYPFLN
mgnify:FL=1